MRKILLTVFLLLPFFAFSQELNCTVTIGSEQVQRSDKRVFETLQQAIFEFMNNTRWTNDVFQIEERIECSILINITEAVSNDEFKATMQVQSRRPVFKSSYNSVMLNYSDNNFQFRYLEFQPLEFSINNHTSNLTSVLAYYAYIILGLDYDSFSPLGGTPWFERAQTIVANAQGAAEEGWKPHENDRNRYWLVENILSPSFAPLRDCLYRYHRKGLDIMVDDMEEARTEILAAIESLIPTHRIKPGSLNLQMFFLAKADELVNIFSQAYSDKKSKMVQLGTDMDPGNAPKYKKIIGS